MDRLVSLGQDATQSSGAALFGKKLSRAARAAGLQGSAGLPDLWQRLELHAHEGEGTLLWPTLEGRLSATRSYPRLRKGLLLKPVQAEKGPVYLLSDPVEGRHFRLGEREAFIVSLLDGEHELQETVKACGDRFGSVRPAAVEQFLEELRLAGLLEGGAGLWKRAGYSRWRGPLILWLLPEAERKVAELASEARLRLLLHPLAGVFFLALVLGAAVLFALNRDLLLFDLSFLRSSWWLIPFLLAAFYPAMVPVVLSHELAHALACSHFGGRVFRLGLMLRHLLPAAFADVSDVYFFPRRARIAVFLAGPAANLVWAALAAYLWLWTRPASFVHLLAAAVMLAALAGTLTSLNPVGGYDGSEMLADWLGVPGLHRRALHFCWNRLRGRPAPLRFPRERRIFVAYGLAFLLLNVALLALALLALLWLLR